MATTLYVNEAAQSQSSALVTATGDRTDAPDVVCSDVRPVTLYVRQGDGVTNSTEITPTLYDCTLAIGVPGAVPTGGTWTAMTSAAIAAGATAQAVQTALNSVSSITSDGGVTVTGAFPVYLVSWNTTGAKTAFTVAASGLTPDSTIDVATIVAGATGVKQVLMLRFFETPIVTATSSAGSGAYWSFTLNAKTFKFANYILGGSTQTATLEAVFVQRSGSNVFTLVTGQQITLRPDIV